MSGEGYSSSSKKGKGGKKGRDPVLLASKDVLVTEKGAGVTKSNSVHLEVMEDGAVSKGDYVSFDQVDSTYYDGATVRYATETEQENPTRDGSKSTYVMEAKWPYAKKNVRSHAANRIDRFRRNLTRSVCGFIWLAVPIVATTIMMHIKFLDPNGSLPWFVVFAPFWMVLFPTLIILCNLMNYFKVGQGNRRVQGGCASFPIIVVISFSVLLCLKLEDKMNVPYQVVFMPLYVYLLGMILYALRVAINSKRRTLLGDIGVLLFVVLLSSAVVLSALKLDNIIDDPSYRATTLFIVLTIRSTILGVIVYGIYQWTMIDVSQWAQYPCQWKTPFNVCSITVLCILALAPAYLFLDGIVNTITGGGPATTYLFVLLYILEGIFVMGIFCTDWWSLALSGILKATIFKDAGEVLRTETETAV